MRNLPVFDALKSLYGEGGFALYMVGGATRDFCLGRSFDDYDFATDALPEESLSLLPNADASFKRFGTIKTKILSCSCDITTLREEGDYSDYRHPRFIKFVKSPFLDSKRRDFTINALYLDKDYKILDFHGGLKDLNDKIIRFIGDPYKRIQEDPLRIVRAERFEKLLGFSLEKETKKAMETLRPLLKEIRREKILEERKKGWKGKI